MFINESPIQCQIEYRAGSEQRTNSVGGMVHYIKTGEITTLITKAAVLAVQSGEEAITRKVLSSIDYFSTL